MRRVWRCEERRRERARPTSVAGSAERVWGRGPCHVCVKKARHRAKRPGSRPILLPPNHHSSEMIRDVLKHVCVRARPAAVSPRPAGKALGEASPSPQQRQLRVSRAGMAHAARGTPLARQACPPACGAPLQGPTKGEEGIFKRHATGLGGRPSVPQERGVTRNTNPPVGKSSVWH